MSIKKVLLAIGIIAGAVFAQEGVAINEENFPHQSFRQGVSYAYDLNQNGYLSPDEIAAVTKLNYHAAQWDNFKGIEFFTECDTLYIGQNGLLPKLDISKLTKLKYLDCSNTMIGVLDLSKNTELTYLQCEYMSKLGYNLSDEGMVLGIIPDWRLDLSNNTKLEELHCTGSYTSYLDLSNNTKLKLIQASQCNLTSLNVSGLSELEELYCYDNNLTTLDLTTNSALEQVTCHENYMKREDVFTNPNIQYVNLNSTKEYPENAVIVDWGNLGFDYNGEPQIPAAEAKDKSGNPVSVTISGQQTNAGTYIAEAKLTNAGNYLLISPKRQFTINKLEINVEWSNLNHIYDKTPKTPTAQSGYPQYPLGAVSGGNKTNVGVYDVSVDLQTPNLNVILLGNEKTLTIEQRTVEVNWGNLLHTYDGTPKTATAESQDPLFPLGAVSGGNKTNAGDYNVSVDLQIPDNNVRVIPNQKTLTINKREISVIWDENSTFTYDGFAKTITGVSSEAEDYPLKLSDNVKTDAGDYTATASLVTENASINLQNPTKTLTILKAEGEGGVMLKGWRFGSNTNSPVAFSETNGTEGVTFAYEGDGYPKQGTKPSNPGAYTVEATFPQTTNYNSFKATNGFVIANTDATPLEVVWTEKTEFVYNKKVQVPLPSVKDRPEIKLTVLNGFSAVDEYTGALSALALITDESQRRLYDLQNNTIEYSIIRKPLAVVMLDEDGERTDNLEVPEDIDIESEDDLLEYVKDIVGYSGFAVGENGETDNDGALNGELSFEIIRPSAAPAQREMRSLRAASSLTAGNYIIRISGDEVFARNYSVAQREISVTIGDGGKISLETDPEDDPTVAIKNNKQKSAGKMLFKSNIVSNKMEIILDGKVSFVVYDMTGNVVANGNGKTWDLRNSAGRFVANGSYLVVVEAKDNNGKETRYSAKIGVKR